eukprot:CAMPEP_0114590446 /NCGR_PEP_ID=MMETSP0125-20121206/12707_1 /TAXON_ID=485358 ORGANISM="Aristerostoma sp., Strain ATCC 50986" /NCGR_SAMPLE_ID=MMETSP0125 /ASSEMBLY_ACC=CAM_ASM_000245 /LENGTH=155 /DNA_ID=CAMNT_0001787967 /DNA_START=9 /DNA_END=476 /DNA_ORIENTATION=+
MKNNFSLPSISRKASTRKSQTFLTSTNFHPPVNSSQPVFQRKRNSTTAEARSLNDLSFAKNRTPQKVLNQEKRDDNYTRDEKVKPLLEDLKNACKLGDDEYRHVTTEVRYKYIKKSLELAQKIFGFFNIEMVTIESVKQDSAVTILPVTDIMGFL